MGWKERITVMQGDIAKVRAEAIVNAANNELWMGSGVAGAIKRAGGNSIEQEAVRQGPIGVGEAVVTGAGNLPSLHIIHAAAMSPGRPATAESVRAATMSSLQLAAERDIESLALPALGTGVGGLSLRDCAREMLGACKEHAGQHAQPGEVSFVLFGENALKIFQEVLDGLE